MLSEPDFTSLSGQTIEVKRMLTVFWQKLKADG
jgi:hypothetical protein